MTIAELQKDKTYVDYFKGFLKGMTDGENWAPTVFITSADVPIQIIALQDVGKASKFIQSKNFQRQLAEILGGQSCSGVLLENVWMSTNLNVRPTNDPNKTSGVFTIEFEFDGEVRLGKITAYGKDSTGQMGGGPVDSTGRIANEYVVGGLLTESK